MALVSKVAFRTGWTILSQKNTFRFPLCALKAILNHGKAIGRSEKDRNDARGEVHLLSGLKHPNIVQYQGSFFHEGTFHIVMEYCQGGDLAERIKRRKSKPFSERQIMDWFVQLCMAVDYIHGKNILHRDLKGDNALTTVKATTPGETNPDKMFDTRLIDLGLMVDVALFEAVRAVPLNSMITHTKKKSPLKRTWAKKSN